MNSNNISTKNGTSKALINSVELTNHINQLVDLYQQKKLNEEAKILEIEQLSLNYNVPAYNLKNLFSLRIREIIIKRIDDIIDSNLAQTDLQIALQSIASDSNLNLREIKQLHDDRVKELETNWLDIGEDISEHISNFNADLDIANIVPDHLAFPIKEYSKLLSVKPVTCLMALLCGLSSCHNSNTRIWLTNSYSETPNLWGMIIGDSGTGKTPIIKTFVEEPIKPLQKKANQEYEKQLNDYQERLALWENSDTSNRGRKPESPKRKKVYYITKKTQAGLANQFDSYPEKTILYYQDELKGLFNSLSSEDTGQTDFLSLYNGISQSDLLRDGNVRQTDNALLSVFGGIQTRIFIEDIFNKNKDDGLIPRFLVVYQPLSTTELLDSNVIYNLSPILNYLYEQIDNLPVQKYKLSQDAFKLYKKYYDFISKKMENTADSFLVMLLAKSRGQIGRIAITLHCVNHFLSDSKHEAISNIIDVKTIKNAVNLAKYCSKQIRYIANLAKKDNIAVLLGEIVNISKQKQLINQDYWLTARDLQSYSNLFRNIKGDKIREMFVQLKDSERGIIDGKGTRLKFKAS